MYKTQSLLLMSDFGEKKCVLYTRRYGIFSHADHKSTQHEAPTCFGVFLVFFHEMFPQEDDQVDERHSALTLVLNITQVAPETHPRMYDTVVFRIQTFQTTALLKLKVWFARIRENILVLVFVHDIEVFPDAKPLHSFARILVHL